MKPLEQLPDGTAVFIDANIFVLAGSIGPIGLQCQELLSRVRQGRIQGFTATFVVAEVTHRVMVNEAREQLQRSARETVEYLQQNPAFIRSLTRHLTVASDIGKAGIDILPLTVKDLHTSKADPSPTPNSVLIQPIIGDQENLQRQDLDPVEEAQIVAWAERMFFDKNQAEIGAMLGKSSDWVSTRAHIHKLPELLKAALRQRPRAIKQMLELAQLHAQDPHSAEQLTLQMLHDSLTVDALRQRIVAQQIRMPEIMDSCETMHNRRAGATIVESVTSKLRVAGGDAGVSAVQADSSVPEPQSFRLRPSAPAAVDGIPDRRTSEDATALVQLQEAASALTMVVAQIDRLPHTAETIRALETAEHALHRIRDSFGTA